MCVRALVISMCDSFQFGNSQGVRDTRAYLFKIGDTLIF